MANYAQLKKASLERLSSDPASPLDSQFWHNTTDDLVKFYTGSETVALSAKDGTTSFTIANNQSAAADVTGLVIDKDDYHGAVVSLSGRRRTDSAEYTGVGWLYLFYHKDALSWNLDYQLIGSRESNKWLGITWSITSAGQVQYVSSNIAGTNYFGQLKFDIVKRFTSFTS